MNKQKIVIVVLALIILFLLLKPSDKAESPLPTSGETQQNTQAGEGNDWQYMTSVNGLNYEVPSSVSIPACPINSGNVAWVNYRSVENKNYSQIYLSPEYVFGPDCEKAPVSGITTGDNTTVIDVQPAENLSDIEKYIEDLATSMDADCDVTVSTSPSVYPNNLEVTVSEVAHNTSFCFAVANRIVFNPEKKVFASVILGHDWSEYMERIARSMYF